MRCKKGGLDEMSETENTSIETFVDQPDTLIEYKTEYEKLKKELDETKKHITNLNKESAEKRHKLNESLLEVEKTKKELNDLQEKYKLTEITRVKLERESQIKELSVVLGFRSFKDAILNTPDDVDDLKKHLTQVLNDNPHYKMPHQNNIGCASSPPASKYIYKNPNSIINSFLRGKLK